MPPRHFWWLYETLADGDQAKRSRLSGQDKKAIRDMLNGNDTGDFW
jgi:isopropylmalate/homocitrate/citramalate synthase